jgi:hypothetical protein
VADDVKRRAALGKLASQMLRNQEVECIFPAKLSNGQRHVVVALPTDTYGDLLGRLSALKGPVNVLVSGSPKAVHVIVFTPSAGRRNHGDFDQCEIGPTSEIGLLLELLRDTKRSTEVRLVTPNYDTELVDHSELSFG